MQTLHIDYPHMVEFTPIGEDAAQVTTIVVHGVTGYIVDGDGVAITTVAGTMQAPPEYTGFRVAPFVGHAP